MEMSSYKELLEEERQLNKQLTEALASEREALALERQALALEKEKVRYLTNKLYGRKSEKTSTLMGQLSFFDDEILEEPEQVPETEKITYERKKKQKGFREAMLKDHRHEKVVFDLSEEEKQCPVCGSEMVEVGEEYVRQEVRVIPATVVVTDYYRKTYECRKCRKDDVKTMVRADGPEPLIKHSFASATLLAEIAANKFELALPLNRQEHIWKDMGLDLSRSTMSNWMMIMSRDWLMPMYELLSRDLVSREYIHADETPIQVLQEPGKENTSKSYFWVFSSIKGSERPVRIFAYRPGRSGEYPADFLKGFTGTLITDAYAGYNRVPGIKRQMCLAHARRYFCDALPDRKEIREDTVAGNAIGYLNRIFELERELEDLTAEERTIKRQQLVKPVLDGYWSWLKEMSLKTLPGSKTGKAIAYSLKNKENLSLFLEDGNIPITNAVAENAIRPVAVGRKNFLFCGSPGGAAATACIYSMIETAKANGLDPKKYLITLLSGFQVLGYDECRKHLEEYLPWNEEIRQTCR